MMERIDLDRGSDVVAVTNAAFDAFYRSRWSRTVRLDAVLTQDKSVVEEPAQEAFARVLSRWAELREPGAYLHRCVNAARMYHARRHGGASGRDRRRGRRAVDLPDADRRGRAERVRGWVHDDPGGHRAVDRRPDSVRLGPDPHLGIADEDADATGDALEVLRDVAAWGEIDAVPDRYPDRARS